MHQSLHVYVKARDVRWRDFLTLSLRVSEWRENCGPPFVALNFERISVLQNGAVREEMFFKLVI